MPPELVSLLLLLLLLLSVLLLQLLMLPLHTPLAPGDQYVTFSLISVVQARCRGCYTP